MYIDFDDMPESARLWWYQAGRELSAEEVDKISERLISAIGGWVTHGMPLRGAFRIVHQRIILVAADVEYQSPSGCSIDSSTRWLQDLGAEMGLNLFDRSFAVQQADRLDFVPFMDLKSRVESGQIGPETLVGNATISRKGDLDSRFFVPAKDTYIKRYFSAVERA